MPIEELARYYVGHGESVNDTFCFLYWLRPISVYANVSLQRCTILYLTTHSNSLLLRGHAFSIVASIATAHLPHTLIHTSINIELSQSNR